jgi:hypothetical protein
MEYITITSPNTASFMFEGYMYDFTSKVFLSSGDLIFPSLTTVNAFTTSRKVSAICPPFTGYEYPSAKYNIINSNHLQLNVYGLTGTGTADVILFNAAGYTKLSDEGILLSLVD